MNAGQASQFVTCFYFRALTKAETRFARGFSSGGRRPVPYVHAAIFSQKASETPEAYRRMFPLLE